MKNCKNCVDLKEELTRERILHSNLDGYYRRANAAYESLVQDVVNFLSNTGNSGNIPPHSIYGGRLLEAIGKANALYHGKS